MSSHLQKEIANLKKKILTLSTVVEERVEGAVRSVAKKDLELGKKIIDGDPEIDAMEVDVEEECLKILALHQPVAVDLRFIVAVLKINNDLERIADLAVNIAERALQMASAAKYPDLFEIPANAERVQEMLRLSLNSLVNLDAVLAQKVCELDDEVDEGHRRMFVRIQESILQDSSQVAVLTNLLSVSRYLERIADHATNIAEDVIYMTQGEIVRHRS